MSSVARRLSRAVLRSCIVTTLLPASISAQEWNSARSLDLVRRATARRAEQLADSGLTDYQARAHGYLTFLAQLGEGFQEPPRIVKADELALQLFWRAPNLSKQRIIGRRDTTLFPTDISYHRDHLGIVQNNFPAIIRLGDGDEVRDVPHPLSPTGMTQYDFAIADSLRMTIPGRSISVYEVKVRPRDDRQPRVIGALYLDRDNGQVVRMALSFTRAAFLDKQLEDLFVVLENGLVGARFWLPRRQEIEIRRRATWLDYPVRGIIRGRWEVTNYELNTGISPARFSGPEIVTAPAAEMRRFDWTSARILDSLPPDIRAVTADEIKRVQAEARTLVREQALRRARGSALAARGISDFARFNRVEGLSLGAGLSRQLGAGFQAAVRGRYGFADEMAKGVAEIRWRSARGASLQLYLRDDFRDAGDVAERSSLVNSFAAQELGSDFTNPYRLKGAGVKAGVDRAGVRWELDVARERQDPLAIHATPAHGVFEPVIDAASVRALRSSLRAEQPTRLGWLGTEWRGTLELRFVSAELPSSGGCPPSPALCDRTTVLRGAAAYEIERPVGETRVVLQSLAAAVRGSPYLHIQDLVYLGGPVSAPGYPFHSLVGDRAFTQRAEARIPIPFPSIGLGRFGRSSNRALFAPHANAAFLHQPPPTMSIRRASGASGFAPSTAGSFFPSLGASVIFGFDLLHLDVSRGMGSGGRWILSIDVSRAFWSVL